jgi:hypothetical protein
MPVAGSVAIASIFLHARRPCQPILTVLPAANPPPDACSVLVAGGGPAGVATAIASARSGVDTVLVERSENLGGNVSDALVHSICGLYLISEDAIARPANGGFAMEFAERLLESGGAGGPFRMERLDVLLQEPAAFAGLCEDLCQRQKNLRVLRGTSIRGVEGNDERPSTVLLDGAASRLAADVLVDTSGDGHLAFLAGASWDSSQGRRLQRPAYIFTIEGVAADATDEEGRLAFSRRIVSGIREGLLDPQLAAAVMRPGIHPGEVRITIDLEAEGDHYSPLNPDCLIRIQILGRKLADELEHHLRSTLEGFENCRISGHPSRPGIRESRRISGRCQLTAADILEGREFEDGVCHSAWPIELRETAKGPKMRYPANNKPCEIPLRALISADFPNLLMAGRCISATHEAQGALRVIGTCLAMGEAAGLAAAAAALSPSKSIPEGAETTFAAPIRQKILEETD